MMAQGTTTAKQLRRVASEISENYYDLLATFNRIWQASNGRDERLERIDHDLSEMQSARRELLARARMLDAGTAA